MDVKVPRLGEGADSGTVGTVFVKAGDEIKKDEPIVELESEKAVASIPSTVSGRVTRVHVNPGDTVRVGQVLISVDEAGAPTAVEAPKAQPGKSPAKPPPAEPEPEEEATTASGPSPSGLPPAASPDVRRVARELGIDLTQVRGSERGGRIVMADLRAYIQRLQRLAARPSPPGTPAAPAVKPFVEKIDFSQWGPVQKKPLSQLRKVIARRMVESASTIPHVTQFDDADITGVWELRKKHSPAYEKAGGRLTLTPIILKALVATLQKHPKFNASIDDEAQEAVFKEYYHIGIAVDTEQGLIVPVLRDVDKKSLLDLSKELESLAQRTRERKVGADEMRGGTFTISNQGGIGGAHFTPIINKPESAILGIGRSVQKPAVRNGGIEPCLMLPLGLSYDHRLIDGGDAARFITELVKAIETFSEAALTL